MKFTTLITTISLLITYASAYSICNKTNYIYKPDYVVPIKQVYNIQGFTVSGNFVIGDGCTFKVTNFSMTGAPGGNKVYVYGSNGTADGYDLSFPSAEVENGVTNKDYTFTFSNQAGSEVSYTDFNQFNLFQTTGDLLLATGAIPIEAKYTGPATTTAAATTTVTVTTAAGTTTAGSGSTSTKTTTITTKSGSTATTSSTPTSSPSSSKKIDPRGLLPFVGLLMLMVI
ncbi:hypothetical protein HK098_004070 [Nowakowskiella sp. JEL0407]|nr:hypothetical protein HK098_004070 [Nowakowskiella sp. JEL0407]